jgi:beta-glucosidase
VVYHPSKGPPDFGLADVSGQIRAAVNVARRARVAIVFASQSSTEGADQSNLSLPGDQNALIEAVAKANRHTVVVLDTGGPVLMPWLNNVQGVIEAWYPGEAAGSAIAAVLFGSIDPSGRLPLTFPKSMNALPTSSLVSFPGVNDVANFGVGASALDVGYRWYEALEVAPLFSFGFGLDFTTFSLTQPTARLGKRNIVIRLDITNKGNRVGADLVQAYVKYPASAGEPPEQLKAFLKVSLSPSVRRRVALSIPISSLKVFVRGSFRTVPGVYEVSVGESSTSLPIKMSVRIH